jgi:hypothetical protein
MRLPPSVLVAVPAVAPAARAATVRVDIENPTARAPRRAAPCWRIRAAPGSCERIAVRGGLAVDSKTLVKRAGTKDHGFAVRVR